MGKAHKARVSRKPKEAAPIAAVSECWVPLPPEGLMPGTLFNSKEALRNAVATWTLEIGFQIVLTDSNRTHMGYKCAQHTIGCKWHIKANCTNADDGIFKITSHRPHTVECQPLDELPSRNSPATIEWIKMHSLPLVRVKPDITPAEVTMTLEVQFGIELRQAKVYRALKLAKKELAGPEEVPIPIPPKDVSGPVDPALQKIKAVQQGEPQEVFAETSTGAAVIDPALTTEDASSAIGEPIAAELPVQVPLPRVPSGQRRQ
jgi:hypothetical protein